MMIFQETHYLSANKINLDGKVPGPNIESGIGFLCTFRTNFSFTLAQVAVPRRRVSRKTIKCPTLFTIPFLRNWRNKFLILLWP